MIRRMQWVVVGVRRHAGMIVRDMALGAAIALVVMLVASPEARASPIGAVAIALWLGVAFGPLIWVRFDHRPQQAAGGTALRMLVAFALGLAWTALMFGMLAVALLVPRR